MFRLTMGDEEKKEDIGLLVHLRWRKGTELRVCMAQDSLAEDMLRPKSLFSFSQASGPISQASCS